MADIVVLLMGAPCEAQARELDRLRAAGHDVKLVEPRFPDCKEELESTRPGLIVVNGGASPSHGRATAGWMAGLAKFRTVPVLFVNVDDKDVARVKKEVPRAQFAAWVSLRSTAIRLMRDRG